MQLLKIFKQTVKKCFPKAKYHYIRYKKRLPKGVLIPRQWDEMAGDVVLHNRYLVAMSYLRGSGIEVGALNRPLKMPSWTKVRYVDRYTLEGLYKSYPEMRGLKVVSPDIVDDGEKLSTFPDASEDFLVSNHFLEHSQDPIVTLKNFLRVIKPGGILYLSLQDKRFTFDLNRPLTPFEHLVQDHEQGAEKSREAHYREFVRLATLHCGTEAWKTEAECETQIQKLMREDYSIHFHVWDYMAAMEFFVAAIRRYQLPCEVMFSMSNNEETLCVLKKL